MKLIQEPIYQPETEEEFRQYRHNHPKAFILNAQASWTNQGKNPDGQYMIHKARCHTLNGDHHLEEQRDIKYLKYLCRNFDVLNRRFPGAELCPKCIQPTGD